MSFTAQFRAFQLENEGSLFSYYKQNWYCLIEARLPKEGLDVLKQDIAYHDKEKIDLLHITSWDTDHCNYDDLIQILNHLRPKRIQVPDYLPESEEANLCRRVLFRYDDIHQKYVQNVQPITKEYIKGLNTADLGGTSNIIYTPEYGRECKNDMSLMMLFRSAGFNVLSLGDCEGKDIADRISRQNTAKKEVDVLILPHHGANNGFTSPELLDALKPKIAVCSSNYDNQYDHPRDEIRQMLRNRKIPLMTTKRGDILITQEEGVNKAVAVNLCSNNTTFEESVDFTPKKFVPSLNQLLKLKKN